jgi:hypothetical protein
LIQPVITIATQNKMFAKPVDAATIISAPATGSK